MQHLNQLGLLTFVKIDDKQQATAFKLVPVSHWHNGQKFPHDVIKELKVSTYERTVKEGLEYYLVPEDTINAHGTVSSYGSVPQRGVEVNEVKTAPAAPAVKKYLKRESRKAKTSG